MTERPTNLRGRSEAGVIAFYFGVLAAVLVALLTHGPVRIVALGTLALFGVYFLVGDFLLALSDERAARENPHDNRISDVGRTVRVTDDFVADSSGCCGKVSLAGETWAARSRDGAPYKVGDRPVVVGVESLVLIVASPEDEGPI